ncbi:hypothetical protein RCL1_006817 [Eukaryota sp. TZLM3-RCL]
MLQKSILQYFKAERNSTPQPCSTSKTTSSRNKNSFSPQEFPPEQEEIIVIDSSDENIEHQVPIYQDPDLSTIFLPFFSFCHSKCHHLFPSKEFILLSKLIDPYSLSKQSIVCLFRLFQRQGPYFRVNKLSIKGVADPIACITVLTRLKFLEEVELDFLTLLNEYLLLPELKLIAKDFNVFNPKFYKKDLIVNEILGLMRVNPVSKYFESNQSISVEERVTRKVTNMIGKVVKLSPIFSKLLKSVVLLNTLSYNFDLTILNRAHSKILKFPEYRISNFEPRSIFPTQNDFILYTKICNINNLIDLIPEKSNVPVYNEITAQIFEILEGELASFNLARLANSPLQVLEFHPKFQLNICLLRIAKRLFNRVKDDSSLNYSLELLKMVLDPIFITVSSRIRPICSSIFRLISLLKRKNSPEIYSLGSIIFDLIQVHPHVICYRCMYKIAKIYSQNSEIDRLIPPYISIYLNFKPNILRLEAKRVEEKGRALYYHRGSIISVEDLFLTVLNENDWCGIFSENRIIPFIFVLTFFDQIFDFSVDFNLIHKFQFEPRYIYSEIFRQRIDLSILDNISLFEFSKILTENFNTYQSTPDFCFSFYEISLSNLLSVALGIGPQKLKLIFQYFVYSIGHHSSGMPDLVCFRNVDINISENFNQNFSGEVMFIEVKSELDKLSEKQICWLCTLNNSGITAVVGKIIKGNSPNAIFLG